MPLGLAATSVAVVAILVAGAALAIGISGGHTTSTSTVTAAPDATPDTPPNSTQGDARATSTSSASEVRSTTPTAGPEESTNPAVTHYHGARFSADIPAGWALGEDELQKPTEVESTWHNTANPGEYLLIDVHSPTHLTPAQDAAPVHRTLEEASDYEEVHYGPGDLAGRPSWMWSFRHSGSERIDYFFETCTNTIAVLGSTTPARFSQLRRTFRAVAQSVRSYCG